MSASGPGNIRSWRIVKLLLPYLLLVVIHLISGMEMEQPLILADEVGYLGNARYLSGTAHLPNMQKSQFYHFGYSLILLPAFWLFTDPISAYKAALTINALLVSALYFPLYFMLESFLDVSRSTARWIAFTCCLYPSLVMYSNFAWSENAFIPFYAVTAALFGRYLVSRSSRDLILFCVAAGFLYTIHPRALPILATVVVYLLVLAFMKVVTKRQLLVSGVMIGMVFLITRSVNDHLKAVGYSGGGEIFFNKLPGRLLPGTDFPQLIERALGQVLYMIQASHGLFLVGLAAVTWWILRKAVSESLPRVMASPRTGVPLFVLITASGVFIASSTSKLFSVHGPSGLRGADFIHGRYNEAFAVLLIAFALAEYCRNRIPTRRLILVASVVAVVTSCLTAVVAIEVRDAQRRHDPSVPVEALEDHVSPSDVDVVAVPGVFPLVDLFGGLNLYLMSLAVMGSFLMITIAMRFTKRGGMALLLVLFAVFAVYNHRYYLSRAIAAARPRLTFVSHLRRVGPIKAISYDAAHHEPEVFFSAQYLLPQTVFKRFDSSRRETPESEAVIAANKWIQARRLKAKFVVSSGWDNALWLLPGEMQSRLPSTSYDGVILGTEPQFGVQESGFHLPEQSQGAAGRWTNGAAAVKLKLDATNHPQLLEIETMAPGREEVDLQVLANRVELWHESIPPVRWMKTFRLDEVPMTDELLIELISDKAPGNRRLGVMVRGIRLSRVARDYEGVILGADYRRGFEESGFYPTEPIEGAPGRWTDGAATLRVLLLGKRPPKLLEIATLAPGRDDVEIRVLANGVELLKQKISSDLLSKTFSLGDVPMTDELLIEIQSDTFTPAENHPQSGDERRLGVAVRSIRLTARGSFEHLYEGSEVE